MTQRVAKNVFLLAAICWGAIVFWLALVPSPPQIHVGFRFVDKIEHAVALAVFTIVLGRSFDNGKTQENVWLRAFLWAVFYGAAIEVAQALFTTTRSAEWADLAADAIGAAIVAVPMTIRRKRQRT